MLARVIAIATCPPLRPSVRPSVRLSVTRRYCVKTKKASGTISSISIADKPARRESLPRIAPIRRAYNVVADNTGLSSCV